MSAVLSGRFIGVEIAFYNVYVAGQLYTLYTLGVIHYDSNAYTAYTHTHIRQIIIFIRVLYVL
jgi:hypothetical protein